ncbi:OspB protein [Vibrio cholerae]|nr:OspB protein [Vibrio cholerae]EGR2064603.1 OspB protein [Vibrio cholerae]EGR2115948.1 OspB protein [Vibrio cholerae]EGR2243437.1 OspB protein [Vibrio cholerae]
MVMLSVNTLKTNDLYKQNGQKPYFSSSVKSVKSATKEKTGLMLVLGEKNISRDKINILAQQIPRVITGKPTYPVLFLHEKAKIEFESSIQSYKKPIGTCNGKSVDDIVAQSLFKAARDQENLTMADVDLKSFRKIYITGHGAAGVDYILSGESKIRIKDIVDCLEQNKILDGINDLRFTCCDSADRRNIDVLSEEGINISNRDSSPLESLFFAEPKSLIEKISSEIWDRGYTNVKVSGYHAKGVFYAGELPTSHLRSTTIPAQDTIKRKNVRVILESDLD